MGITRLRRVKREIRVLGLASRPRDDGYTVVGVVYRGSLWLDGVLALRLGGGEEPTRGIAEAVRASPHHPQIRVILLQDEQLEGLRPDPYGLRREAERPVIALSRQPSWPEPPEGIYAIGFELELGGSRLHVLSVGLRSLEASAVLRASTRRGETTPEALRVAGLIAEAWSKQKT
ncbi:MAG: hypothetical protein AYL28_001530 [Candidatus Bathyarchaeota archaeon B23]|nr:MAG: hypothetical protein AYL28_001530 [Candidatus Bathyarchaeota archaeon B23]